MADHALLHSLCINSCNDHGCTCPQTWADAMRVVLANELRADEARRVVDEAITLAHAATNPGDSLPSWEALRVPIVAGLEQLLGDKPRTAAWLIPVLQRLGIAADEVGH